MQNFSHSFRFSFCILFCLAFAPAFGQQVHRCAFDEAVNSREKQFPGYRQVVNQTFEQAKNRSLSAYKTNETVVDTVYRIPVVVHIVWNQPDQNLDDSLVHSQIRVLNQDYRRKNPDTLNTREIFWDRTADAKIEFFLATEDPDGNPTTGITRTQTPKTSLSNFLNIQQLDENAKTSAGGGAEAWDPDRYLNLWVCNMSDPFLGDALLGYAYPPSNMENWPANSEAPQKSYEGVVVHYKVFGENNPLAIDLLATADRGRTAVHEVGHYLGLRHIWGDGGGFIGGIDCTVDDGIEDTPNSGNSSQEPQDACNPEKNTCTETVGDDLPDMWENYMDYSDEKCQNMFTRQQIGLMRSVLEGVRGSLPVVVFDTLSVDTVPTVSRSATANAIRAFRVSPNPAQNFLNIDLQLGQPAPVEIEIANLLGQKLSSARFENPAANFQTQIDLTGLHSGLYLVKLRYQNESLVRKLQIRQ